jgi:hypothetical protein
MKKVLPDLTELIQSSSEEIWDWMEMEMERDLLF